VRGAAELLESLERKQAGAVRSLEAAVLAAALLREAGLPAVVGAVKRLEAPVRTPSVTPGIGRYLAIVYAPGKLGRDPLLLLDPMRALRLPAWAGEGNDAEMAARVDGFTPLDDGSAAAHLLALRAYVVRERDPRLAYQLSALALRAAAPAPELHLLRATVLAAAGGTDDALAEARRALALADGPAGRLALAWVLAETGRLSEALPPLRQAIAQEADYWPARALAAGLEGAIDPKRSEPHLEVARRVAPEEPMVLTAQAASLLGKGEAAAARDLLRRATRRHGGLGSLLLLYRALLQTGDADQAAETRRRLLQRARDDARAALERALEAMAQAARGEAPASAPAAPPSTPPRGRFRLPDVRLGR
jgi:Tfp pilus assembly protein PilF